MDELKQKMGEQMGADTDVDMQWHAEVSSNEYQGNDSYTESGQLKGRRRWLEKNGRKIQEITIYNESRQVDYLSVCIDDRAVMHIPYVAGQMSPDAKDEYNRVLNNL